MTSNLAYESAWREELIGGKLVAMSPAATNHNRIAENIDFIFRTYLKGKKCVPLGDGYKVFLSPTDHFVPDFMIVCDRDKIKPRGVFGPPDLVVEVLSPSTAQNDRGRKKRGYEASGVSEYWIADPVGKSIEVYLLKEGRYSLDKIYYLYTEAELAEMPEEDREAVVSEFTCHLYDDLTISLADIFDDLF